jgi:hypothetical protein
MAQFLLLPLSVPLAPLYTPLPLTWHPPAVTGIVLLRLRLLVNWPCLPHPSPNCPTLLNFPEPQLPTAWQRRPWDQSALAMRNRHKHATWTWHAAWTWTWSMDMDIQHGHGYAAWIWSCSMDLDSGHAWMHGCQNARMAIKSSVWHPLFSVSLQRLVRHRHFGIMVSPVPLVTD